MNDKMRKTVTSIVDADLLSQHITVTTDPVTTDPVILDAIQHHHIEFDRHCRPVQATKPRHIIFSSGDKEIINFELANSSAKGL